MKLTVLCPTYNHEKFIENTLRSFTHQVTDFDFEVLVLDDASTDNTSSIIKKYAEQYPNLIKPTFQKNNLGVIGNVSQGIKKVKTPYFIICEGDDYWCNDYFLQKGVDFLEKNPQCVLFCANSIYNDTQGHGQKLWHTKCPGRWFSIENPTRAHVSTRIIRFNPHFPVGDLTSFHYFMSLGPCYYHSEVVSVYNFTGKGIWSSLSSEQARHRLFNTLYLINKMFSYKYDNIYTKDLITKKRKRLFWALIKKILGPEKFWDFYFNFQNYPLEEKQIQWWDEI